jgi:uncharacterized protein YndB with AHSA1/START domain
MTNYETVVEKDLPNKTLHVVREFKGTIERVWAAWTQAELLDKWWAPRPWKAVTQSMDFKQGGVWLYYMLGPEGERHYCRVDIAAVEAGKSFSAKSNFCDENGNITDGMPTMYWHNVFSSTNTGSKVDVTLTFDDQASLEQILQMGFEGGFKMGLSNLDELLEA